MNRITIVFVLCVLTACAPKVVSTSSGTNPAESVDPSRDGTSIGKAVIAKDIPFEYNWVREHYPGSRVLGQALINQNKKAYDRLDVQLSTGTKIQVYFDINSFFGKF